MDKHNIRVESMHNILKLTCILTGLTNQAIAESKSPNPSDLTETSTSAYVGVNNQGGFKGAVSADVKINARQTGMFTIEGSMNKDGQYSDSRLQYFHVFNTDNSIIPKAAASLDIIDNDMFTSASVGATLAVNSGVKGLNIFPRVGVLAGKYSQQALNQFGVNNDVAVGGSAALYIMYTMGRDGTYIGVWPEYNYLGGEIEASTLKTTIKLATPFSADKQRWGELKLENTDTKMLSNNQSIKSNDTMVWASYKFYF